MTASSAALIAVPVCCETVLRLMFVFYSPHLKKALEIFFVGLTDVCQI